MYDLIVRNGIIIDGTGGPGYIGNVAVKNGKIIMNPQETEEVHTIYADEKVVCPGFIDSHSHSDYTLGENNEICYEGKVSQGITTEVVGQCGHSLFPINPQRVSLHQGLFRSFLSDEQLGRFSDFTDFKAFLHYAKSVNKVQNYAFNVGHCTVRAAVMGTDNRKPTGAELDKMKELVSEAMEAGCFGLTSGLIYIPGTYCATEELVELCKVIKPYGGVYATHMRNESGRVVEAVKEAIEIAGQAEVPLVISHHKACGKENWGKSKETLKVIREARKQGICIMQDQYPYTYSQTNLNVCIPPEYFVDGVDKLAERLKETSFRREVKKAMSQKQSAYTNMYQDSGGFDGVYVVMSAGLPEAEGKFVSEYAKETGKDPFDAYFDILVANRGGASAIYFSMNEEDVERIYQDPYTAIGSDAITCSKLMPVHPRVYGSFTKPLAEFSRKKGLVSLEEAIRKQTSLPAKMWKLEGKGILADGYDADLVIFDPKTVQDKADYKNSRAVSEGILQVVCNGEIVFEKGKFTGNTPGKCITRR